GAAGQPGQGSGEEEGNGLERIGLESEGNAPRPVLADRLEPLAKGGMNDPPNQKKAGQEITKHEEEQGGGAVQIEDKKELPPRHRLDSVLAAGKRSAKAEEVNHLGERQGDHREVDALAADCEGSNDGAENRRNRGASKDRHFRRKSEDLRGMSGGVRGAAKEHRVAKREQANVANH